MDEMDSVAWLVISEVEATLILEIVWNKYFKVLKWTRLMYHASC